MAEGQTFYDDTESELILRLAAQKTGLEGGMTRERLLATAEELGISIEAVEAAERQVRDAREEKELRREYAAEVRRGHWSSVSSWLSVSILLFGVNLMTEGFRLDNLRHFWCLWPIGIWGFVLVGQVIERALKQRVTGDEGFRKWRARRERRRARQEARGFEKRLESVVEDALEDAFADSN